MQQYALSIALPPVFAEDNFSVSDCNRDAWRRVESWPDWPGKALLLTGPAGSGKSHLGHIWVARALACVCRVSEGSLLAADAIDGPALIEDIHLLRDEQSLLHLLNYSRECGHFLLLTSALPVKQLPFALPDLTSRLAALPSAAIAAPDDAALAAALRKQFADRQLKVPDETIAYLLPRMERSFGEVRELVTFLDAQALKAKKPLTVPFLKRALEAAGY